MTRILVTLGSILIVVGLAWPWLMKLGLGHLPGDIVVVALNYFAKDAKLLLGSNM